MVDPERQQALLSRVPFRGSAGLGKVPTALGNHAQCQESETDRSGIPCGAVLCHTPSALGYGGSQWTGTEGNPFLSDYHSQPTAVWVHHLFPQLTLVLGFLL